MSKEKLWNPAHQIDNGNHSVVRERLLLIFGTLLVLSLSCGLPIQLPAESTPTPILEEPSIPAQVLEPLPPMLVETVPMPGSDLPLDGPLKFYFNQAMVPSSVEGALSGYPALSGSFEWLDDATMVFIPHNPWQPETELAVTLGTGAQSASGLALHGEVNLSFKTVGFLHMTHALPEPNVEEVDPSSAVVATFNRPVVPLGAEPGTLPAAFSLEPFAQGSGEWVNTSTYIFYPDPPLSAGTLYTTSLVPELTGTDGAPLDWAESWSFTTSLPRLIKTSPEAGESSIHLDTEMKLWFNQSMEVNSVEDNFSLLGPDLKPVAGSFDWDDDFKEMTFKPAGLLQRGSKYTLRLDGRAQANGGAIIGVDYQAELFTVPDLFIESVTPWAGEEVSVRETFKFTFSSPLAEEDLLEFIDIEPYVYLSYYWDDNTLSLYGRFEAETDYALTISSDLTDKWGSRLGSVFKHAFRTNPLEPELVIQSYIGSGSVSVNSASPFLTVQAVNISTLDMQMGSVSVDDFIRMMGPGGWEEMESHRPADLRTWIQAIEITSNRSAQVAVPLTDGKDPLSPGVYWVSVQSDEAEVFGGFPKPPFFVLSSNVHLTYKVSATDVLVWAVNANDRTPVAEEVVFIYAENGSLLISGETDQDGVFRSSVPVQKEPYSYSYAVMGSPGDENFALSTTMWNYGINGWDFGYPVDRRPPHNTTYLYTDRPIYRPGQTVYFRAVTRQVYNGRYDLPDFPSLPIVVIDNFYAELETLNFPLSEFGTAHGAYTLPDDADPGYYTFASGLEDDDGQISFQVAEYRKPEIDLQVEFISNQVLVGESVNAEISARFFFDAPAGNTDLEWSLYVRETDFNLPGYSVGSSNTRWLGGGFYPYDFVWLGNFVAQGQGVTGPDGRFNLEIPLDYKTNTQIYTLEITVEDESGFPVSARAEVTAHPAPFYVGVKPDTWSGRAKREMGFMLQVVDWNQSPTGAYTFHAAFNKVVWERHTDTHGFPVYEPAYTTVSSADFSTDAQGVARLLFTPPEPGTYQLEVSGGGAITQTLVWVGGAGQAVWPDVSENRLRLTADEDEYQPGDTAKVFIPNPLGANAKVLVTTERGVVFNHQVFSLSDAGTLYSVPLTAEDAPNVYLSVTILGTNEDGKLDFRHGIVELTVETDMALKVEIMGQPERSSPGEEVTFAVRVTDSLGGQQTVSWRCRMGWGAVGGRRSNRSPCVKNLRTPLIGTHRSSPMRMVWPR
jgi:hypothetical protein